MMVNYRKMNQRSDSGTPEPGRSITRIGEETERDISTFHCDEGDKPDGVKEERTPQSLSGKLKIGTWNVRSLYGGKHIIVEDEMNRNNIDILGISEHR